jgi:predicted nuclease of predicted toxin-antitoxin system
MKFLLDMGLAPRTATYLRGQGHDAVHLREQGQVRLSDSEIVRQAESEGRVIVTFDLDFARIIALQRLARPSVILFRLDRFTTDEINAMLNDLIATYEAPLSAGAVLVVDPHRIRMRTLPIW